ncbi:hypothetical protein OEZ85_000439 [Tetradesmus obliquus]|uniref:Helicase-associated domain-containing protein n=1 Tax=Tetradesmus obliquus TaxID=3088 RepID=A0ABY8UIK3_TETOB|nr:hypothetical protein OEZ85_000439 [Tetradesmus obliquus]
MLWFYSGSRALVFSGGSYSRQAPVAAASPVDKLLEGFWEARGVFDPAQRQELVRLAKALPLQGGADEGSLDEDFAPPLQLAEGAPLPGIPTTWALNQSVPEIAGVSRRLLELHALLGGGADVDVVWMVTREPQLLAASRQQLLSRLMAMRLASATAGVDVVKVVEAQPSLLLLDEGNPLADWARLAPEELAELIKGWEQGVASDSDPEWQARAVQLRAYHRQHGDTSVGWREGDDPELARWANKQRRNLAAGLLVPAKAELLQELRFEPDETEAEWLRWFLDLARFKEAHGHASPMSLSAGADLYLINWCSVQRVAHRCKVLSRRQLDLLNSIDFDWSGADPLS